MKEMIVYILSTLFMALYFELLGQYLLSKLNTKRPLSLGYGLFLFMAFSYVSTSLITAFGGNFYLLLFVYVVFFAASAVLIIKDAKKIKYQFKLACWIPVLIIVVLLSYYSYNTTLGDLDGFDSLSYLNYVSTNVGISELDSINLMFGGYEENAFGNAYVFQQYYKFASCLVFVLSKICNCIGITALYSTIYIWVFQYLFFFFFAAVLINIFLKFFKEKKILNIMLIVVCVFFVGRIYYNNVFGFYGNSFRQIGFAYAIYELQEYLEKNNNNLCIFYITLLGTCAFSSSAVFSIFFILFGLLFLVAGTEKDIFKQYSVVLLAPTTNILFYLTSNIGFSIFLAFSGCVLLYFVNSKIIVFFKEKKTAAVVIAVVFFVMLILSYAKTGKLFNLEAFTNSLSARADMTIDYFSIDLSHIGIKTIYILIVDISFVLYLILCHNDSLAKIIGILIICVFNPLCIGFYSSINIVFHRTYDIAINLFTLFFFTNRVFELIKNKYIQGVISVLILCLFVKNVHFDIPYLYHSSFETYEGYDYINKMSEADKRAILILKDDIYANGIQNPYIISENKMTQSEIPDGQYLFGRSSYMSDDWGEEERKLYELFYPRDYNKDLYYLKQTDYSNVKEYIEKAGIDYLVLNNEYLYYNNETKEYYSLYMELDKYIYDNLFYFDEDIAIYKFTD